ncbi:hypothetical protein MKW94_019032 [Papaver nudicaule]|uniref:Uncharacterized protein n=1 Tax=Papaver nudicaule TaxID=74823 RepID=A0AA41VN85_PAPNU|nr:hypothetical protein [Papaver nudicaule]
MKKKHHDGDDNVTTEIEETVGGGGVGGSGGGEVKEDEKIQDGGGDNVTVAGENKDEHLINVHVTQEKEEDDKRNDMSDKKQEEEEENQRDGQVSTLSAANQNPNGCVGGEHDKSKANSEVEATEVKAEGVKDEDNVGAANDVAKMESVKKEERETKPHVSYLKANKEEEDDDEIEELEEEESEDSESESDKEELITTSSLQKQHHPDLVAIEERPLFLNEEGGSESGSEYEQTAFIKELESFCKEHHLDFKPPKFYGEGLNLLKLWRAVVKLGGYDQVTTCKLWRQVGESFNPPKTCTTVSWTFRIFYEKALLEYEKHKIHSGELHFPDSSLPDPKSAGNMRIGSPALGSGRARRDAASRAMQGWHSQRFVGNDEDKNAMSTQKRESQLRAGLLKRRRPADMDHYAKSARANFKATKQPGSSPQRMDTTPTVIDIGHPADWVKVNVRRTRDCFEVYALVPGLLREEVRVQSDPSGRVVISGQPEEPDNPWGVTAFKKVITLPSRIDPHQTSAIVTLHGQLFVRVPFEQSDS